MILPILGTKAKSEWCAREILVKAYMDRGLVVCVCSFNEKRGAKVERMLT